MAHARKLIRQAVVALLVDATAAGTRVESTRVEPHRKGQLPAVSVYTLNETVDVDASLLTAPLVLSRNMKLEIAAWVGHSEEYTAADRMDDIAEQIEEAMNSDRYIGGRVSGLAKETILESTELSVRGGDGNDPLVGVITLTYSVDYNTDAAEVGRDDFLLAHTTTRSPGVEDPNAAVDNINVRTT